MCFICLFLGFTASLAVSVVVSIIMLMSFVAAIPITYVYLELALSLALKIVCATIIVGGVLSIAFLGFLLDVVSDFTVFSFVMGAIYIIIMIVSSVIFYQK